MTTSSSSRTVRRTLLRLVAGAFMVAGLGAPSPGYTGNCGGTGATVADPFQFCVQKEMAICARECGADGRGEWTAEMCISACGTNEAITSRCMVRWPDGCAPTQAVTQACVQALMNRANIATPSRDIPECMIDRLCGASALTSSEPEGI